MSRNKYLESDRLTASTPRSTSAGVRFEGLDALRGIGAPIVVYGHYSLMVQPYGESYLWRTSTYLLVDVFFLLSGFVLAHAFYDRPNFNFWEFTKKRIFRLWPVHMVTLVAMALLMVLAGDTVYKTGLVLNALMIHNVGIGHSLMVMINSPSWSLSVEFVTNLIVAALVLAIPNKRLNSVVLAGMCIASATILFFTVDDLDKFVQNVHGGINTGLLRGTLTLTMGILAYRFFIAHRSWFERTSPLRTCVVGVLLTAFFVSVFVPVRSVNTDLLFLPMYALLILALTNPGPFWMPLMMRFRFLAAISFSLYMVHMVVIKFVMEVPFWTDNYYGGMLVTFALSIALATALHYQVERPCYKWMTEHWSAKPLRKGPSVAVTPATTSPAASRSSENAELKPTNR